MSQYIIKVENTSGVAGTIISDRAFSYTDNLNDLNKGQLRITGTGETKRGLFEIGSKVYFYRDGTLEFTGLINSLSYLDAGGISADLAGFEVWLGKEKGTYVNSPWTSTASETIAGLIIGESSFFTAGTVEAGADIDLKVETSSSIYNALSSLTTSTAQDIGIDYTNLEVDILDHKGSSTSVATLNDRIQISDLTVRKSYPIANDVRVFGKGDGDNQIKSNSSTSGQDAGSKSTYGIIQKDYTDSSVISVDQADNLANKLVAQWKDPISVYEFDVINPNLSVVAGDVITLNAKTKGLNNEEVRVVGIERGVKGDQEFLTLQVTNKAYSQRERNMGKYVAELQKQANVNKNYMQGTTNVLTFSEMINANNAAPLRVLAYLSESDVTDEAGNLRVNSFTLDYDVDPFRSGVGSASEDNVSPNVSGASGNDAPGGDVDSHKHDPSDSGHEHDNATQTSSANYTGSSEGSDSATSVSCSSGTWTTICSEYVGTADGLYCSFFIKGNSGGQEDIQIRVRNSGVTSTNDAEFGIYLDGFRNDTFLEMHGIWAGPASSDTIYLQVYPHSGAITLDGFISLIQSEHTHSITSWDTTSDNAAVSDSYKTPGLDVDSHGHDDGSYAAASHNHNVSIGDGISDAGSINATEVNIYVDFWNGSSWVNKHSVLTTGKTIDYDVDLSDGGTYPDAAGFWRVRVLTDSASADLVQGTIKCKHELDV